MFRACFPYVSRSETRLWFRACFAERNATVVSRMLRGAKRDCGFAHVSRSETRLWFRACFAERNATVVSRMFRGAKRDCGFAHVSRSETRLWATVAALRVEPHWRWDYKIDLGGVDPAT